MPTDQWYFETTESLEWDRLGAAASEQTERIAAQTLPSGDQWRQLSDRFAPTAEGVPEDEAVAAIAAHLGAESVLVDAGCGAGRLSVPLSRYCGRVIAIDPAEAMLDALRGHISERGISNIEVVESTWQDWDEQPADAVLIAHLLYGLNPIIPFLEKADRVARERVFVLLSTRQPIAHYYPLWKAIFGEERANSLGAREFEALLRSWGIEPEVVRMTPTPPRPFPDAESAVRRAAGRLAIEDGSESHARLEVAVTESLVEAEGGYQFKWNTEVVPYLFSWETGGG